MCPSSDPVDLAREGAPSPASTETAPNGVTTTARMTSTGTRNERRRSATGGMPCRSPVRHVRARRIGGAGVAVGAAGGASVPHDGAAAAGPGDGAAGRAPSRVPHVTHSTAEARFALLHTGQVLVFTVTSDPSASMARVCRRATVLRAAPGRDGLGDAGPEGAAAAHADGAASGCEGQRTVEVHPRAQPERQPGGEGVAGPVRVDDRTRRLGSRVAPPLAVGGLPRAALGALGAGRAAPAGSAARPDPTSPRGRGRSRPGSPPPCRPRRGAPARAV